MSDKNKINYVELTGNLAKDARVSGNAVFLTIATYNGKDLEGNNKAATFIDVAIYGEAAAELKKGQRIIIKGNITNYRDKKTNYIKLGVTAFYWKVISSKANPTEEIFEDTLL